MRCLSPAFCHLDTNIDLVFSGFASLLASNRAFVFFCRAINVFSHYMNIIGTGQKLMCHIQYQYLLAILDPCDGIFQSKVQ
jgi:hypothetical protein